MKKSRGNNIYNKISILCLLVWMLLSMGIVTHPIVQDEILFKEQIIYEIQSGDNLWNIAGKVVNKDEDIRYVIDQIKKDNGIEDTVLRPGEKIVLYKTYYK